MNIVSYATLPGASWLHMPDLLSLEMTHIFCVQKWNRNMSKPLLIGTFELAQEFSASFAGCSKMWFGFSSGKDNFVERAHHRLQEPKAVFDFLTRKDRKKCLCYLNWARSDWSKVGLIFGLPAQAVLTRINNKRAPYKYARPHRREAFSLEATRSEKPLKYVRLFNTPISI